MMDSTEQLKDWYVRYNFILKKRYTKKQKDRFLQSLSADLNAIRPDVKLDTFKLSKHDREEYRNVYVGDLNKADKIVCTYYDTPAVHLGPYAFFDKEKQQRNTLKLIVLSSVLYLLAGLLFTWLVAVPVFQQFELASVPSILTMAAYIVYFYLLRQVASGWPMRKNLVRNTSSVLLMMQTIQSFKQKNVAYAFLDAGAKSNAGLERALLRKKSGGKFYLLDSIGSDQAPYRISKESVIRLSDDTVLDAKTPELMDKRLICLISADQENGQFQLDKEALNQTELGVSNMATFSAYLEKIIRGKAV